MRFAAPHVDVERCTDGATILRSAQPLRAYDRAVGDWLVRWAAEAPDRRFLAERVGDDWRALTYAGYQGYVNQRAVLTRRAAHVEALHAGGPGAIVM